MVAQAVYCGPVAGAAPHLESLGCPPPAVGLAVPDYLLDMVIRSRRPDVAAMVDALPGSQCVRVRVCAMFVYLARGGSGKA
jgi:hypothetical protein